MKSAPLPEPPSGGPYGGLNLVLGWKGSRLGRLPRSGLTAPSGKKGSNLAPGGTAPLGNGIPSGPRGSGPGNLSLRKFRRGSIIMPPPGPWPRNGSRSRRPNGISPRDSGFGAGCRGGSKLGPWLRDGSGLNRLSTDVAGAVEVPTVLLMTWHGFTNLSKISDRRLSSLGKTSRGLQNRETRLRNTDIFKKQWVCQLFFLGKYSHVDARAIYVYRFLLAETTLIQHLLIHF